MNAEQPDKDPTIEDLPTGIEEDEDDLPQDDGDPDAPEEDDYLGEDDDDLPPAPPA